MAILFGWSSTPRLDTNRRVIGQLWCFRPRPIITSKEKGYPFETALPDGLKVSGVVLADQIKSLDWRARKASQADAAPSVIVNDVLAKLETLLG